MSLPKDLKIAVEFFTFPDHTYPNGFLPAGEKGAQACWYYYVLAQKQKEKVGDSTEDQFGLLEDNLWMDKRYEQTARTVAMIYQLESPDEFLKFMPYVEKEARANGLPVPAPEYTRPLKRRIIT